MKNLLLRKSVRVVLATLSTIFIIILIWIMLDCFPRNVIVDKKVLSYEVESTLNYIGNKEEGTLKYYYIYKGNKRVDSIYKYYVTIKLKYVENQDVLVEKIVPLSSSIEEEEIDTSMIKINTEVEVPYDLLYKEQYGNMNLNKNNIIVDIQFTTKNDVTVDIDDPEYISIDSNNYISIPLNQMEKNKNSREYQKKNIGVSQRVRTTFNYYLFLLTFLSFIAIIPIAVLSYASLFNLTNYDEYKRKLNSIKKKYYSLMIVRRKVPSFKKKEIIEVDSFDDILEHLEDEDIVFFEKDTGKEAWFYLEKKLEVYLYILRLEHTPINMRDNTIINIFKKRKK